MLLGVDFGTKNVGISLSDESEKYSLPYKTFNLKESYEKIKLIVNEKKINTVIIGYPYLYSGEEGSMTQRVDGYIKKLQSYIPFVKIIRIDEFLSSQKGIKSMKDISMKHTSILKNKDSLAASIILQSYIDSL